MCKVKGSKPFTSARKHLKGTKGESNNRKTQILERRSNRKQMPEYITGIPERGQKYSRANNKLTLPKNANISRKGRHLIEHEPNVEDDTLAALIELDRERIPENISKRLKGLSKAETANYAFCERGEIGLTHLSMCISEDKDQSLAELIARYAEERRIPFVLGAIYIKALISQRDLFYYNISYDGYKKVRWQPQLRYVPPEAKEPPEKRHRRNRKKPLTAVRKKKQYDLPNCPICRSPTRLLRCGRNKLQWHVCCTDPNGECENYVGITPQKTEKQAANAWIQYVEEVVNPALFELYLKEEDKNGISES